MSEAAHQLISLVHRIERLQEEIDDLNGDKSEVYAEAKSHGFDVKALKAVIRARKMDQTVRNEQQSMFDLYWHAIHGTEDATRVPAREAAE